MNFQNIYLFKMLIYLIFIFIFKKPILVFSKRMSQILELKKGKKEKI